MMIVQCQACKTQFRVDESRIQGRGARMRCRRCGEAIIVMKDSASSPGTPPPKNLFDLRSVLRQQDRKPARLFEGTAPAEREPVEKAPVESPETGPAAPPEPAGIESPDETVSLRVSEETPTEAAQEPAEPTFPAREPEAPAAWEPPPAEEPAAVESPDETVSLRVPEETPTDAAMEPAEPTFPAREPEAPAEEPAAVESPDETVSLRVPEGTPTEAAMEPAEPPAPDEPVAGVPPPEPLRFKPTAEEKSFELMLNDAESLDFLKEEHRRAGTEGDLDISGFLRSDPSSEPEPEETAPPAAAPSRPEEEPMPDRLEAIQRELQEIGGGSPDIGMVQSPAPPASTPVPPIRTAPPASPRIAARPGTPRGGRPSLLPLAVLFLLIAGGGAYLGFTPGGQEILRRMIPAMESLWLGGEKAEAAFSVGNLIGYYEPKTRAGTLFVIKGTVTNQGRKKRSGIRVKADLLTSGGEHVASKSVFAGNVLSGDELRSSSKEAIEKGMANRWGDKLSNLDIAPGKSIPFMVVFFDAPAGIEEYRLEARENE